MSIGNNFMQEYLKLSNPNSNYYKQGYQGLLDALNVSTPTVNTLAGASMMHGGSYKGSQITANLQRQGAQTQNASTARKGFLDMYMGNQGLAQNALQGAQQAYQYEDSKPSFWEELGGYALGGLSQAIMPGVGGFLDNLLFGPGAKKTQPPQPQQQKPFNYNNQFGYQSTQPTNY